MITVQKLSHGFEIYRFVESDRMGVFDDREFVKQYRREHGRYPVYSGVGFAKIVGNTVEVFGFFGNIGCRHLRHLVRYAKAQGVKRIITEGDAPLLRSAIRISDGVYAGYWDNRLR